MTQDQAFYEIGEPSELPAFMRDAYVAAIADQHELDCAEGVFDDDYWDDCDDWDYEDDYEDYYPGGHGDPVEMYV